MPETLVVIRLRPRDRRFDVPATLAAAGPDAVAVFAQRRATPGMHLLLAGDPMYCVTLRAPVLAHHEATLRASAGRAVYVVFPGRSPVKRVLQNLAELATAATASGPAATPLDLTAGRPGAAPLWLLPAGTLSTTPARAPAPPDARETLVTAARWISARRTSTFERLFPPSAFHPEEPARPEGLSVSQADALLDQLRAALAAAAVGSERATRAPEHAAQTRSAALTVLSHVLATALKAPDFRRTADLAAAEIFALVETESGHPTARPALRAHAIYLLQLRAPALAPADRTRATRLVRGLLRAAPPYDELRGPWRFAMCSAHEFHAGECDVLTGTYHFKEVPVPADAPPAPATRAWEAPKYRAFQAPFLTPEGQPVLILARSASPDDENAEMASSYFTGLLINRHAQLGSFDMRAAAVDVRQAGYKLMMNSQCAGLTTRFAISRMFPEADVYSSWDSTYFRTGTDGRVVASEGLDCFVAVLQGMVRRETHAEIDARIRQEQWSHPQASVAGFSQFVGPAHPLVVARFEDVNQDGRADCYDGFLDFDLRAIAEDVHASATPRDPGVAPSQLGGEAAAGLNWAAGSLNRVAQYSDLWAGLPGESELQYVFQAGGFYSQREPPQDVSVGTAPAQDLGRLPALCRYERTETVASGLRAEVMLHGHLAHAAKEYKRLLCAAEAMTRAFDLGLFAGDALLKTPLGQRGALLLTLAGLLEYPADQNQLDALWEQALAALNLPAVSRSAVRACITEADHELSNYYGSLRGLQQLVGRDTTDKGALGRADPVAHARLADADPRIGRAAPLALP